MIRISIVLFAVILFFACKESDLVSGEFQLDGQWLAGDHKLISFDVADTSQVYQMDLDIDHATNFPYQNLYVRIKTIFPDGEEQMSVTSLELANADGTWSGDCGKKQCTLSLPLQQNFTFPEKGKYTWSIEPYMRVDTVKGIDHIAIHCTKVKT